MYCCWCAFSSSSSSICRVASPWIWNGKVIAGLHACPVSRSSSPLYSTLTLKPRLPVRTPQALQTLWLMSFHWALDLMVEPTTHSATRMHYITCTISYRILSHWSRRHESLTLWFPQEARQWCYCTDISAITVFKTLFSYYFPPVNAENHGSILNGAYF
jgi:hypothetical protein